jgi:chromosomal replication initiator protein
VAAPSEFVREWVTLHHLPALQIAARDVLGGDPRVSIDVDRMESHGQEPRPAEAPASPAPPSDGEVDSRYTFAAFVVGRSNQLAQAACQTVAELPSRTYNPLFLHGPPGLGKTHLLAAIANYLNANAPALSVRYTTAESFTNEFVLALKSAGADAFKARYRDLDVLLIDDVQFLQDKSRTEEEFFHTFDAVHERGGQIVLAGDRPPHGLSRLAARLRDRFEWGLMVELGAPDLPTRLAVLGRLANEAPLVVEAGATLREIAASAPANLRQLEGALTRVVALASITSREPTPELAREALTTGSPDRGDQASTPASSRPDAPSIAAIQDAVCAILGITRAELLSSSRTPRIARARHIAMYMSRQMTGSSLAEIARGFDRDHSTVLHAIRRIDGEIAPGSPLHESLTEAQRLLSESESS